MPKRAPRGRGSVFEDKARGRWVAQLKVEGKLQRKYAATEAEAWDLRDQLVASARLGVTDGRSSLAEYLEEWVASQRRRLRPRTLANYESQIRTYIAPPPQPDGATKPSRWRGRGIGHVPLAKLGPQHLRRLFEDLEDSGLSAATVRQTRAILRSALKQALNDGLVTRNVAALTEAPQLRREERRPLTSDQARVFLESLAGDRLEPVYATALLLGLRQSELLGLRWQDVDLEEGVLTVAQTLQRSGGAYLLGAPKTEKSRRRIPLPPGLVQLLEGRRVTQLEERVATGTRPTHDLVFTTIGGNPINGTWLYHDFLRRLERLSLPRVRFHDLRHSTAGLLLAEGFGPREVMAVLGHSTIAMTMDVYAHAADDVLREKMGRLDEWRAR